MFLSHPLGACPRQRVTYLIPSIMRLSIVYVFAKLGGVVMFVN